jgi:hypothetical protein
MTSATEAPSIESAIQRDGYAFVDGAVMRELLTACGPLDDWEQFSASWNDLALDTYMKNGGRYRRRRHAVFSGSTAAPLTRQPHQPHYQTLEYNPLHGGLERWFEPVSESIGRSSTLQTVLTFCRRLFGALAPDVPRWRVEVHQFRIEARSGEQGQPTPEGLHRDGVDYVLVLLVNRRNIVSGVTAIHALAGHELGHFTLTHALDAALVDDTRVAHGVTAVEAIDPSQPAYRDVLVVTFKRLEARLDAAQG